MKNYLKIVAFLFFVNHSYSQSNSVSPPVDSLMAAAYDLIYSDYHQSVALFGQAERILRASGVERQPILWISLLQKEAEAANENYDYESAKKYLTQSIEEIHKFFKADPGKTDSLMIQSIFILAVYYHNLEKFDDAAEHLDSVEALIKRQTNYASQCLMLFQVTQYRAATYLLKGEYESTVNEYLSSIPYYDCYRNKSTPPNYILIYRNIGSAYVMMGDHPKALAYFQQAKKSLATNLRYVKSSQNPSARFRIYNHALVLYNSLAEYFIKTGNLDSAQFYFNKSISLLDGNESKSHVVYSGLAKVAKMRNQVPQALALFAKALALSIGTNGERNFETARIYRWISQCYEDQGDYGKALASIQKALNSLQGADAPDISDGLGNPPLHRILSNKEMLIDLRQKSNVLLQRYHQSMSETDLTMARETIHLAIQLLDSTRNDFSMEKDKVILGEEAMPVYELALNIAHEFYAKTKNDAYLSESFGLMEKSKGAVLLDHLKLVRSFSGIPSDLLERERQLKAQLTIREEELFEKESQHAELSSVHTEISELKKKYAALNEEIKRDYPGYYALRIGNSVASLKDVQQNLKNGQALVEYFVGDSALYAIWISRERSKIYVSALDSLGQTIEHYRSLLTDKRYVLKEQPFTDQSVMLAKKLTPWLEAAKEDSITSLIIVPHSILNYVPFEVLAVGNKPTYLLERFYISYALSASLLSQQHIQTAPRKSMAAFNADYAPASGLAPLQGSFDELEKIVSLFGYSSRAFTNATADEFRKEAGHYRILHLALHSFLNDDKPLFSRLIFSGSDSIISNSITANELYSMELNSEMVVLSACETGIGVLHRGEGMMSLSRAFMYAGVPSTVMSLWKVPDQASALLMADFYKFIRQGFRKDVALTMAKKEFIKNNPEMAHPFFWAGFVVNGKTDAIITSDLTLSRLWPWMLGVLIVAAGIFFGIRFARTRKATARD